MAFVCSSQVIDAYTRMLKAKKGEVDAIVTTAEPLTPQQEKTLAAGLKAQVKTTANFLIMPQEGSKPSKVVLIFLVLRYGDTKGRTLATLAGLII